MTKLDELKAAIGEEEFERIKGMESADELFEETRNEFFKAEENGELNDAQLGMVVGGMSKWKAVQIVTTAYYDVIKYGYSDRTYSASQINEALGICDGMVNAWGDWGLRTIVKFLVTGSPF